MFNTAFNILKRTKAVEEMEESKDDTLYTIVDWQASKTTFAFEGLGLDFTAWEVGGQCAAHYTTLPAKTMSVDYYYYYSNL